MLIEPSTDGEYFEPFLFEIKALGSWVARAQDPRGSYRILDDNLAKGGDLRKGVKGLMEKIGLEVSNRTAK